VPELASAVMFLAWGLKSEYWPRIIEAEAFGPLRANKMSEQITDGWAVGIIE
jgi:hypothetical protein